MARSEIKCPAGLIVHPVLSPNEADIQCRVQGGLQPAQGSPCCGEYARCRIWAYHVAIDRGPSSKRQRDSQYSPLHPHTLGR